jgi:DNA repair protein RecO (recombination protein O)
MPSEFASSPGRHGPSYKVTGINLKGMPLGEYDRLLTILTPERGLLRVTAPGVRKPKSKIGGRSNLFTVNQLLIDRGRTLDRIAQAETLESYPGLSQDLGKLAAGQYLAELALFQALSDQPQADLFYALNEHLGRLNRLRLGSVRERAIASLLAHLCHGIYHLLAIAGLAPQVQQCSLSRHPLEPDFRDGAAPVGFNPAVGGVVRFAALRAQAATAPEAGGRSRSSAVLRLGAIELWWLQQLPRTDLPPWPAALVPPPQPAEQSRCWLHIEQALRQYAQYHFAQSIRSADLLDTYANPNPNVPV